MRGPEAEAWIQAALEEMASFKKLEVYEEVSKNSATSIPLPMRLIVAIKPTIQGGPADLQALEVVNPDFK